MLGGSTTRQLCKCWYGKIYKNNCYGGKKQGVEHCAEYYTSMHSIYTHLHLYDTCMCKYICKHIPMFMDNHWNSP